MVGAIIAIIAALIAHSGYRIHQGLYGPWGVFGRIEASRTLLARPENYKPAATAMVRLMNTDPSLLKEDMYELPPNWTPTEIGKLGPLDLTIENDFAAMSTTSGLAEFTGYKIERDKEHSTDREDAFDLTVDFGLLNPTMYHFTLPKATAYSEEDLVRGGLAELSRRIAARAAKTDPAISYGTSDSVSDRHRLLYQHPQIAKKLGLPVPDASATRPAP